MKFEFILLIVIFLDSFILILSNRISQIDIDDNFLIELEKTDRELESLEHQLKDYQKILNSNKKNLSMKKNIQNLINLLDDSYEIQKQKREYYEKSKETIEYLNREMAKSKIEVSKINEIREENGLRRVNQIVQEMMNRNHVKIILQKLILKFKKIFSEILLRAFSKKPNQNNISTNSTSKSISMTNIYGKNSTIMMTNSSLNNSKINPNLRYETLSKIENSVGNNQFSKMRIWSSFRLEEDNDFEETNSTKNTPTGRQIARACIASFLGATRPNFCMKSKENSLSQDISCPDGFRVLGTSCIEECSMDFEFFGGICWKSCPAKLSPCGPFCGDKACKNKNKFLIRGFNIPEFLTLDHPDVSCPKYYKKQENICHAECDLLGMVSCGSSGCASSRKICEQFNYKIDRNSTFYFTSFLGYLYSLKSSLSFDYSDKLNFNTYVDKLLAFVRTNEKSMNETYKIYKRINSNLESKEYFLNYVARYSTLEFKKIKNIDELLRIENVCKRVSTNLLQHIVKEKNKFDLEYLSKNIPTPYVLFCNSMLNIYDNEKCVKNLASFAKKLGLLHLATLSSYFVKPACNFEIFQS